MKEMKYKPGDVVVIRRDMEFNSEAQQVLDQKDYTLTIKSVYSNRQGEEGFYRVEEFEYMTWREEYIKCLYEDSILDPINSRFDILDL
jgi:hypothetical protein